MTAERIESTEYIVKGVKPLSEKYALEEASQEFFKKFQRYPTTLKVSPYSFNALRAAAERYDFAMSMEVKVEREWEDSQWLVSHEDSKTYAVA